MNLTPAEQKVFDLKMRGLTNKQIADELGYAVSNGRPAAVEQLVHTAMKRNKATNAMHMGFLIGKHDTNRILGFLPIALNLNNRTMTT